MVARRFGFQSPGSSWVRRLWVPVAAGTATGVITAGLLATGGMGRSSAGTVPFTPGQGNGTANVFELSIPYGGADLGTGVGTVSAAYEGNAARASAAQLSLYILEVIQTLQLCGESSPLVPPEPETANTDADGGKAQTVGNESATGPGAVGAENASASPAPKSSAAVAGVGFDLAPLVELTGGSASSATVADATSALRTSTNQVDIGSLSLLDGLIKLGGLKWVLDQSELGPDSRTTKTTESWSFVMGSAKVAGVTLPTSTPKQAQAVVTAINAVTGRFGIRIVLPQIQTVGANIELTPLTVALGGKTPEGPALYDLLAGPSRVSVVSLLNEVVSTHLLFDPTNCKELDGLLVKDPQQNYDWNALAVLTPIVLQAIAASFNGGAQVDLNFGGATTYLSDTYYPPVNLAVNPGGVVTPPFTPGSSGRAGVAASPGQAGHLETITVPAIAAPPGRSVLPASFTRLVCSTTSQAGWPGCWKGDAPVAAAAAALVAGSVLVADEVWRRRRRQTGAGVIGEDS